MFIQSRLQATVLFIISVSEFRLWARSTGLVWSWFTGKTRKKLALINSSLRARKLTVALVG